jgi:hypothetical protein
MNKFALGVGTGIVSLAVAINGSRFIVSFPSTSM